MDEFNKIEKGFLKQGPREKYNEKEGHEEREREREINTGKKDRKYFDVEGEINLSAK